ncbi:MAG: GNAT family N-acetyltransferase [Candidatus Lokiarchaeia archaeon]
MKIKKISLDDRRWDKFCLESDDCWYWHTSDWMKYTMEYTEGDSELLAFYIEDGNGDILAICPLIKEKNKLSFSESFGPNPALRNGLSKKLSKSLIGQIFSRIDSIAAELNLEECIMSLSTLAKNNLKLYNYNYLMKYGFENISLNTQILVLDENERTLWGDIKKSHRNEIKRGNTEFTFSIDLPYSKDDTMFKQLKNLHFQAAGRMTRSEKTWEMQLHSKIKGNAVIIIAYKDEMPIGGIFTILYKDGAYYGVSANHPDFEYLPVSHSIQWEMIKWLKQNRYKYYELGYQHFSDQPFIHPSQKEINICKFKRHFGGYTITHHRGIKRYKNLD